MTIPVPVPVGNLINEHPTNPCKSSGIRSGSRKAWAERYPPIEKVNVFTAYNEKSRITVARFDEDCLLPEYADDAVRKNEPAYPTNFKRWKVDPEAEVKHWFVTEVSSIVLAAFTRFPLIQERLEAKPLTSKKVAQTVDLLYSVEVNGKMRTIAIGETKRNIINAREWRKGKIRSSTQLGLSQEFRGYADIYGTTTFFCYDGEVFLMLHFRAKTRSDIKSKHCPVDCWVIPRVNPNGIPIRYALYRLFVQGFRRCQGMEANDISFGEIRPHHRQFFSGAPVWKVDGNYYEEKVFTYSRDVDTHTGAIYWKTAENEYLLGNGNRYLDTQELWEEGGQVEQEEEEEEDSEGEEDENHAHNEDEDEEDEYYAQNDEEDEGFATSSRYYRN